FMMRAVVGNRGSAQVRALSTTDRRIHTIPTLRGLESALEPSPRDPLVVEKVANILSEHSQLLGTPAIVIKGIGVANHTVRSDVAGNVANRVRRVIGRGVARDKVDCARSRRSKHRTVGVVIQRKVL